MQVYCFFFKRKTKYPAKVNLLRETNEVIISKRSYQVATDEENETGFVSQPLLPGNQR